MDTLEHKAGVCRDYSHIGIALCRSLRIPARMVVGYLYQLDPMDLHAWFEAYLGGTLVHLRRHPASNRAGAGWCSPTAVMQPTWPFSATTDLCRR
jgi:transglutaminase-like putative cysteine protease